MITTAPWVVGSLMAIAAGAAWWLRTVIDKGQIETAKEYQNVLTAEKRFAETQLSAATEEKKRLLETLGTLQTQLRDHAPPQSIAVTTASAEAQVTVIGAMLDAMKARIAKK